MLIKRYGACWCIAAMLAAGMWGHLPSVTQGADVNADGLLDVRDVQSIAAQVLAQHPGQSPQDVNDDGQVDVRDFQKAVAELGQSPSIPKEPPPEQRESKACLSRSPKIGPATLVCYLLPSAGSPKTGPRCAAAHRQFKTATHAVERFLFHLTPNAPPCLA